MTLELESEPIIAMKNFCDPNPDPPLKIKSFQGNRQPTKISGYEFIHQMNAEYCLCSVTQYLLDSMKSSSSSDTGRSSSQIKLAAESMFSSQSLMSQISSF